MLVPAPATLTARCLGPTSLPSGRDLVQSEVETLWVEDRSRLIQCGDEKAALGSFYEFRDKGLAGDK